MEVVHRVGPRDEFIETHTVPGAAESEQTVEELFESVTKTDVSVKATPETLVISTTDSHLPQSSEGVSSELVTRTKVTPDSTAVQTVPSTVDIDHRVGIRDEFIETTAVESAGIYEEHIKRKDVPDDEETIQLEVVETTVRDASEHAYATHVTPKLVPTVVPADKLIDEHVARREELDFVTVDRFTPEITVQLGAELVSKTITVVDHGKFTVPTHLN